MPVNVFLDGLDDLRKALRDMPDELTNDALAIVATAANDTEVDLKHAYPDGPMRQAVHVEDRSVRYKARFVVVSPTNQATWWEFGTQNRVTQAGWNRGREPAHENGLIKIAKRHRLTMRQQLIAMVQAAGFQVSETLG